MSLSRLQNDSATFRWDFNMCYLFFVVWMSLWLFSLPCKHYNIVYKRKGCYSPLTPCSTAWAQVRLPLFMSTQSEKIEVIPVWIHNLPRVQQMIKLQDLETSITCWQARFGNFHNLLVGNIWKIPNFAGKIWKIQDLAGKTWKIHDLVGKIWKIQDLAGKI